MQKSKKVAAQLWIERQTIRDKVSMFRSKEPDTGYIRIMARYGHKEVVVREFTFTDRLAYNNHWDFLKSLFQEA